ncbi:MAG: hypothetical protein KF814_04195 [Nitrospiraceae bacterium]|nr:hypothetical protein [Nitrospiraceae bacterium]
MPARFPHLMLLTCALALFSPAGFASPSTATADSVALNPVLWGTTQKSTTWAEELLGQVVTYQTLTEKGIISGNFKPYLEQMAKVREFHRTGNRRATYDGVNQFMVMLEARVGDIDAHSAEAIWDFCYRVTPDEFHARDRHVRAKGSDEVKRWEEMIRDMEERASMSF